jgi:hypothetical protein
MAKVDTYRASTGCGVVLSKASFPRGNGLHTVELRGTARSTPLPRARPSPSTR